MKEIRNALGTVIVELTRRCNMKCKHCMRGPAQCRDMKPDVMRALIKKMSGVSIDRIALGGGESTLVPELVSKFFRMTAAAGIYPAMYCIVTNGKVMTRQFMNVVARLQREAEVYIMTSFDNCHDQISRDEFIERCEELKRVTSEADRFHQGVAMQFRYQGDNFLNDEIKEERHTRDDISKMGRGATVFGGYCAVKVYPFDVKGDGDDEPPLFEDDFYVDVDGNVWPHCDLSYRFMSRRKKYCLGNVTDPGFDWLAAAVRFNLKFAKRFPLKLVEPGYEAYPISNDRDYRDSTTQRRIRETAEVAKSLGMR